MADPNEDFSLDMLGEDLKAAVLDARTRTADGTIMARIAVGLVSVERGTPAAVLEDGLSLADGVAYLGALE
jgi:hypothetical protein